jgi:TIR domain-containing protein
MTEPSVSIGHAYICHAPQDAAYVDKLAAHLTAAGIPVTYDREGQPGVTWEGPRSRVDASAAVVVVMTQAASEADRVVVQITRAEEKDKPILPLLLRDRPFFILSEREHWDVTGGRMPSNDFVNRLRSAVGITGPTGSPPPSQPKTSWWKGKAAVTAIVVVALLMVGGAIAFLANRDSTNATSRGASGQPQISTTSAAPSTASALPLGAVKITTPADGAVVDKCARINGQTNLDSGKTILFAVNRTEPVDPTWYFGIVGSYLNGFVPADWSGTAYFGSATRQSYDLFVLVMDVQAAKDFWNKHKSTDGSYAAAPTLPQGVVPAAHVHVRQGTTDDC